MVVDMSPLPLYLVFCYLATYTVTEGGIVRGIIGQNVSFTMTFHNINGDLIHIKHNASVFAEVWPHNNDHIEIKKQHRVRVEIGNKTASGSITVIINILNITTSDSGMYNAMRPVNPTEILDCVLLETTEVDHYTIKASTQMVDTTETNHYKTQTWVKKEDPIGTYDYTTTAIAKRVDTEDARISISDVPSERHLLYIIIGMGVMFAATFFACLLHKIKRCFRVVRGSTINAASDNDDGNETLREVNQAGNYWTIVSDSKGEMSTAMEMDVNVCRESLLVGPSIFPTNSEPEKSVRSDDIYVSQQIEGYFNPINSITTECNDYIHPIHSDSLDTSFPTEVSDFLISNVKISMQRDVKSISI